MFFPRAPFRPPHLATWRHCRFLIGPTSSILTGVSLGMRVKRLTIWAHSSARATRPPPCHWLLPCVVTGVSGHRHTRSQKPLLWTYLETSFHCSFLLFPSFSFFRFPTVKLHFFFCSYSFLFGGRFLKKWGRTHGLCRNFPGHFFLPCGTFSKFLPWSTRAPLRSGVLHSPVFTAPVQIPVK